jgi:hypothetical protein
MYNIEKIVKESGGKDLIKFLVEEEGYSKIDLIKELKLPDSIAVYNKIIKYCNIIIPFPKVNNRKSRKWMIRWLQHGTEYWNDDYLVEETLEKLENPILNTTGLCKRYVISMWGHPSANKNSHQVKAHQIVWELVNECFLPQNYEIYPIDNNFLNLDINNLNIRTSSDRKSFYATGEKNHFYTGTPRYINYTRGWNRLSKKYRESINKCEICNNTTNLNTHHIISYWLFQENDLRVHTENNLLCVCDSCHGKIHQYNKSIVPHISEMKYKNLLELLESLKSQVPESLMETYKDVEKQLGLTDNQQPSILKR